MLGKIAEMFGGIPRMALVVVVLLALIGGVWYWKRSRRAPAVDRETETVKAERAASQYADMIAKGLPERRDEDDAELEALLDDDDDESELAVTDEYVKTVGKDQEISANDGDEEEYEPMDA